MSETFAPAGAMLTIEALLAQLDHGHLAKEATAEYRALARALKDALNEGRSAKGSLSIRIRFAVEKGVIEATGEVVAKGPPPRRGRSIFHAGLTDHLSALDPMQPDLPLRVAPSPSAPVPLRTLKGTPTHD